MRDLVQAVKPAFHPSRTVSVRASAFILRKALQSGLGGISLIRHVAAERQSLRAPKWRSW